MKRTTHAITFAILTVCLALAAGANAPTKPHGAPLLTPDPPPPADTESDPDGEIHFREALVLPPAGHFGRSAVHTDAVEAQIVAGTWKPPGEGDTLTTPDDKTLTWESVNADDNGWFSHAALDGGYAYIRFDSDRDRVMLLAASGHSTAYVNNEPRAGDPYQFAVHQLPIQLRAGRNDLLFHCGRGRLRVSLIPPPAPIFMTARDATLPDLLAHQPTETWGAIVITNTTPSIVRDLRLRVRPDGTGPTEYPIPNLAPMSIRKTPFPIRPARVGPGLMIRLDVTLLQRTPDGDRTLGALRLEPAVLTIDKPRRHTFRSRIDGSVQYFAVNEKQRSWPYAEKPALILTLHGAGVEAIGQARAYAARDWGVIVAPTNRRAFGFDWEDWGRIDAIEVLDIAERMYHVDPERVYLTGHSMGGHGTWIIGVTYPDRFAAIAPSAGWISFWSYVGADRFKDATPIERIMGRATNPSDTLALSRNLVHNGVYVLHGDRDDNVPVEQARRMRRELAEFHTDFAYYERPGAGHWWGNACVDWPPLFDFLRNHTRPDPATVRRVRFITANPGVSARCDWATIETQTHALQLSTIDLRVDPKTRTVSGTTDNVARLALDLTPIGPSTNPPDNKEKAQSDEAPPPTTEAPPPTGETPSQPDESPSRSPAPITITLDDQTLSDVAWPDSTPIIHLRRDHQGWHVTDAPPPGTKNPARAGPFKAAFDHNVVFVYGTAGTPEENAWSFAKARYDAETFAYRANGSIDVIPDTEFDPTAEPDRSVILFGHAQSNRAWQPLLADSPIQVTRGQVRVASPPHAENDADADARTHADARTLTGEDIGGLFIRPRPGSDVACVGVVTGTGPVGMRLTDRLLYFVSGVAYPDFVFMRAETLRTGTAGILTAGFFAPDWSVTTDDAAWADNAAANPAAP